MSDRARPADAHGDAAEAFVDRALAQHEDDLVDLYVFGSAARGEANGLSSDVDVLVVLADDVDREAVADSLRDVALDVMIEYGPVVELHVFTESTFRRHRREGNPFVRNAVAEGRSYA